MKVNLDTFSGGSVIFDQCHMVWRAVAIKLQHMWMCLLHSRGDEGMTLLNSCQVNKTGFEIKKCFYISVPYFPGLSESYKKIFKYAPSNL